jgi:hypothetical protein
MSKFYVWHADFDNSYGFQTLVETCDPRQVVQIVNPDFDHALGYWKPQPQEIKPVTDFLGRYPDSTLIFGDEPDEDPHLGSDASLYAKSYKLFADLVISASGGKAKLCPGGFVLPGGLNYAHKFLNTIQAPVDVWNFHCGLPDDDNLDPFKENILDAVKWTKDFGNNKPMILGSFGSFGDGTNLHPARNLEAAVQFLQGIDEIVGAFYWGYYPIAAVNFALVDEEYNLTPTGKVYPNALGETREEWGEGVIYGVLPGGDLHWYRHLGYLDGSNRWVSGQGKTIGNGWDGYTTLFAGGEGVIYGVLPSGGLDWYRHLGYLDGSKSWKLGQGTPVGTERDGYTTLFAGGEGVVYGVLPGGDLHWFPHVGYMDGGIPTVVGGQGKPIGNGWDGYTTLFAGARGVIYGVLPGGDLHWYRHRGYLDGSNRWVSGQGKPIGNGWDGYTTLFAGGEGVIYGVLPGGDLHWYRHLGYLDGSNRWVSGQGKPIGNGWDGYTALFAGGVQ